MASKRLLVLWAALVLAPALPAAAQGGAAPSTPVVLELFTSQGCSSCPSAETFLSRLGLDPEMRAVVVPLAYHVDYWNRLGWRDPFSDAAWSERQRSYERALAVENGAYTPQLVVNGETELNGTDGRRVLSAIAAARHRRSPATLVVDARIEGAGKPELAVDVSVEMVEAVEAGKLDVRVALFENGLVTDIARGENEGLKLPNDFVVRRLETALSLAPAKGARKEARLRLKLDREWKPENLGVAVFLQDPKSMRILDARAVMLAGAGSQASARSSVTTSTSPRQP